MTNKQIEEFSVGYPYPTNYVEILLKKYNYNIIKTHENLCKPYNEVIKKVQSESQFMR